MGSAASRQGVPLTFHSTSGLALHSVAVEVAAASTHYSAFVEGKEEGQGFAVTIAFRSRQIGLDTKLILNPGNSHCEDSSLKPFCWYSSACEKLEDLRKFIEKSPWRSNTPKPAPGLHLCTGERRPKLFPGVTS